LLIDSEDKDTMGAVFYGEQRMRVVRFTQQEPHVTAQIELLSEYPGLHAERRTKQASQLFQRYLNLVRQRYHAQVVNVPLPDDPIIASYLLAAVLYLPLETKQRWLESASAEMRLQEELAFLNAECDKLTTILALSQHTQRHYATPDSHLFASLVSQN
jgi:ATP-dependent Lon protease